MEQNFGEYFVPVFTPPWNCFSPITVKIIRKLHFKAISMKEPCPPGVRLPYNFSILPARIDLHLRSAVEPNLDFALLMNELLGLQKCNEPAGIIVRHQRMTPFAFEFLNLLLYNLRYVLKAQFCSFRGILSGSDEKQPSARLR